MNYFNFEFKPETRRWMFWLAKIFGKPTIGADISDDVETVVVGYLWRNKLYMVSTKSRELK